MIGDQENESSKNQDLRQLARIGNFRAEELALVSAVCKCYGAGEDKEGYKRKVQRYGQAAREPRWMGRNRF